MHCDLKEDDLIPFNEAISCPLNAFFCTLYSYGFFIVRSLSIGKTTIGNAPRNGTFPPRSKDSVLASR